MIRAVVFDLDDTLLDTGGRLTAAAQRDAAAALVRAGLSAPVERVERLRSALSRRHPAASGRRADVDLAVCRRLGCLDPRVAAEGHRAFYSRAGAMRRAGAVRLLPGVEATLTRLEREVELVLLTAGHRETQRAKIDGAGLRRWFREVIIVDIDGEETKRGALGRWTRGRRLEPGRVLVVGDTWGDEIAAGWRLGMRTCWVHRRASSRRRWPPLRVDAAVPSVADVPRVLARLGGGRPTA